MSEQTDREYLEGKWERVTGYWQTLYEPTPFWVDMGESVCVNLRATGVDQRSAYAEARRLTEERLEEIRQLEEEIDHIENDIYVYTDATNFTADIYRRILTRLQSILADKKRGLLL